MYIFTSLLLSNTFRILSDTSVICIIFTYRITIYIYVLHLMLKINLLTRNVLGNKHYNISCGQTILGNICYPSCIVGRINNGARDIEYFKKIFSFGQKKNSFHGCGKLGTLGKLFCSEILSTLLCVVDIMLVFVSNFLFH